jgi:streptogramin lyase
MGTSVNRRSLEMSRNTITRWTSIMAIVALCLVLPAVANAQSTYTWVGGTSGGSWTASGSWIAADPNYPTNPGDVAKFVDANGVYTVTLDSNIALGQLQFLPATGTSAFYTIAPGVGPGVLHFMDANDLAVIQTNAAAQARITAETYH